MRNALVARMDGCLEWPPNTYSHHQYVEDVGSPEKVQTVMLPQHSARPRELRLLQRLLISCAPGALFLLVSTAVLSLSFIDIKYTYEPVLTGTRLDYLVDETYSMAWLFFCTSNIAFFCYLYRIFSGF